MNDLPRKGFAAIGVAFLVLGLSNLASGRDWVVWFVLGVVFGGLGIFSRNTGASDL